MHPADAGGSIPLAPSTLTADLVSGVAALLRSRDCADLALDVGDGTQLCAHSLVLSLRCPRLLQELQAAAPPSTGPPRVVPLG